MATHQSREIIPSRTQTRSPYMEFAKLRSSAKYNLATSGMASFTMSELGASIDQLEINPPVGYGYEPLHRAIAARYRVPVESVVPTLGTSMANYFALAACAEPGDEILIEQPTYALLLDTSRYLGFRVKRFQRPAAANYQIDVNDLHRQITPRTRVIVLCNLHNPTGATTPESTLRELGTMAKSVGARVIVDEVYQEMLWEAQPRSAFHIDPDVFLSTNSLTKAYGLSGIRCGWVLAAPEIVEQIWHLQDLHMGTNVHPAELLGVIAFEKLAHIAAVQKKRLDDNRALLREVLESQSLLEYFWPEHGTVIFPRIKRGKASDFCTRLCSQYAISVVPGEFFEDPQRVRIGVGGTTESVWSSLEQLRQALDEMR
ncbi:MAG TPA: pyridoxal phosphate-dependent aminotransferase [Terriglobales bacterium]|nr:pyridoxal phosphate-dependent aminotransferase [Terriglobales bacterium]